MGLGNLGLGFGLAAIAAQSAQRSTGFNGIPLGGGATELADFFLNNCANSRRPNSESSFFGVFSANGGTSSSTNNQSGGSSTSNSSNAGNPGNSNDLYRDSNKKDSDELSESEESNSTDQEEDEDDWDSSDEHDERNHRYKYIAKKYPGRSTYAKPLEIDHTIPMAVWKELLKEIKKYAEKDLPKHLKRALKIFRIILKNKDIFSLSAKDLDKLMKEFPAIEILKLIHRYQFSTGNKELQKNFNKLILEFIKAGNWDKAIEYIFRDQYKIAKHFDVDQQEIENILNRQRSFVKYLLRKGILTNEEARKLLDVIDSLID